MKCLKVTMTPQQIEKLMQMNQDTGLSMSEIIRRAFDAYVSVSKQNQGLTI